MSVKPDDSEPPKAVLDETSIKNEGSHGSIPALSLSQGDAPELPIEFKQEEGIHGDVTLIRHDGVWTGKLQDFFEANDYDPLGQIEVIEDLEQRGIHHGGGGAQPEFTLIYVKEGK